MIYSRQQCGELRAPSYDAFRYDAMENRWRKSFTVCGEPRSCPIISVQNLRVKSFCSGFPGCQRVSFVTLPENFQVEQDGVSQVRAEIRTRGVVYEHKNGASAGFGILDPRVCVLATSLGGAKEHLEHAARDFGGHRGETVRASEEAIRQLELRLKYDKDRAAREMLRFSRKQISSKKKTQPNLFSARAFLSLDA